MRFRKRLFEIIESAKESDRVSNIYDIFMMITIVTSIIPLAFKEEFPVFVIIDKIAVVIFIIDYLLRVLTADYKLNKGGLSFILYPITPLALIDLLCILPSLNIISGSFRLLKVFRLFRTFRVFRIFKAVRYSKSIHLIKNVFKTSKKPLITVGFLAAAYVLISALVIFNAEPDTFDTFFDAIYWATVSLTTMGYGDIYPVTTIGRIVTMVSSIFGIAIIALPSGIITAGLMEEINKRDAVPNTEKDSETTLKKE
ncbi:MAG: ion transporter [Clostridia bacterium]|nr:ion transporter [Clostridia bacterium]